MGLGHCTGYGAGTLYWVWGWDTVLLGMECNSEIKGSLVIVLLPQTPVDEVDGLASVKEVGRN